MIEGLKCDDKRLRAEAAEALGEIGSDAKDAVAGLTALAKDKNKDVRKAASDAIRKVQGK